MALDSHTRSRFILLAAVLVLLALGAVHDESYPLLQAAILIPGAFLLAALVLLALPMIASQKAEGGDVPWGKLMDFLGHNAILAVAAVFVLVAVAVVSYVNLDTMSTPEKVVFYAATAIGLIAGLSEWFRDLKPDAE